MPTKSRLVKYDSIWPDTCLSWKREGGVTDLFWSAGNLLGDLIHN